MNDKLILNTKLTHDFLTSLNSKQIQTDMYIFNRVESTWKERERESEKEKMMTTKDDLHYMRLVFHILIRQVLVSH